MMAFRIIMGLAAVAGVAAIVAIRTEPDPAPLMTKSEIADGARGIVTSVNPDGTLSFVCRADAAPGSLPCMSPMSPTSAPVFSGSAISSTVTPYPNLRRRLGTGDSPERLGDVRPIIMPDGSQVWADNFSRIELERRTTEILCFVFPQIDAAKRANAKTVQVDR